MLYRFANDNEAENDCILLFARLVKGFAAGCCIRFNAVDAIENVVCSIVSVFLSQWLRFLENIRFQLLTQRATRHHVHFAAKQVL